MSFRWRRLRGSLFTLRIFTAAMLILTLLYTSLPYDNAIRLSLRLNRQKVIAFLFGPLRSDRWIYEDPVFPVDWSQDVAIILKTGYGTQERATAWLDALSNGINPENVVTVGDFASNLRARGSVTPGWKVHDVVSEMFGGQDNTFTQQDLSSPRAGKYRTLGATIAAGEDELARNLSGSFGWELDAMKFIPALDLAFRTMPGKAWYLLVDDDTYILQPSMDRVLGHFNPSVPYYLGNAVGDYRQRFAHGGSAIALSRATMHKLFAPCNTYHLTTARRESLTEIWGDRLLARTLLKLGINIEEGASRFFNGEQPWASRLRENRFCIPVTAFHRLSPNEMADVGRVFRKTVDPVMWVDLWEIYGAPSFEKYEETPFRRDWNHVGQLDEHTTTVSGVKAARGCWNLCKTSRSCLAWTWELQKGLCYMSHWVTVGNEAKGMVSGLHVEKIRRLADVCQ